MVRVAGLQRLEDLLLACAGSAASSAIEGERPSSAARRSRALLDLIASSCRLRGMRTDHVRSRK